MPEDQSDLDIAREHFVLTMNAFKNALQRGEDPFYNHVLDGLEAIAEMTQSFEKGEFKLEPFERVQIIPVDKMIQGDYDLYDNINACPVCSSTNIRKVIIIEKYTDGGGDQEKQIDGHRCNECWYTYAVDFHLTNEIIPEVESENSDSPVPPSDK